MTIGKQITPRNVRHQRFTTQHCYF